jgi:hypothetical protein
MNGFQTPFEIWTILSVFQNISLLCLLIWSGIRSGIQMVKARWQPKMLQPFENWFFFSDDWFSGTGHLNTRFQIVCYPL